MTSFDVFLCYLKDPQTEYFYDNAIDGFDVLLLLELFKITYFWILGLLWAKFQTLSLG